MVILVQQSPDLVTVNIVNIPGLVKELLLTILLLLLSKITVDLVKNLDLVKVWLLTKNFTKSGLYILKIFLILFVGPFECHSLVNEAKTRDLTDMVKNVLL